MSELELQLTEQQLRELVEAVEEGDLNDDTKKFSIIKRPIVNTSYTIHLSEHIENNFAYVELLETLRNASEKDQVTLYLANYGGLCSTGFQIVNAMRECKCGVDVVLDAPSYSMGAIIAVAGKSLRMNPSTFLMFHNYSGGDYGKGKERLDATKHYYEHFHRALKKVVAPFLSAKELSLLKQDNDVYVSCDDKDIKTRLKRHFK